MCRGLVHPGKLGILRPTPEITSARLVGCAAKVMVPWLWAWLCKRSGDFGNQYYCYLSFKNLKDESRFSNVISDKKKKDVFFFYYL